VKRYSKLKGYKYLLRDEVVFRTEISGKEYVNQFIALHEDGRLVISPGYAWDGPSGPTIDTPNFMAGSLAHDALYQLIRKGKLPYNAKEQADTELYKICIACGMSRIRATWVYWGVRMFGKWSAKLGLQERERVYRLVTPQEE